MAMTDRRSALPDDIPETGYIIISVGVDADGVAMAYSYEGLAPESAIGYLVSVTDLMRDEVRFAWQAARMEAFDEDDEDDD